MKKSKIPIGMILILIWVGIGIIGNLSNLRSPGVQLGPFLLEGILAIICTLMIVILLGTIFFGIIKRFAWARKLAIGWYIFSMVLFLVNLLFFMANKSMYDDFYSKILTPEMAALMTPNVIMVALVGSLVFGWIIGIIIIIYLLKKKDFFIN